MTDDGLHPWAGGQHGAKGGGSVTVPLLSGDPGIAGAHTTTLGDLRDAGIDPLAAFGSAFALNRVVGQERINQYLNTLAGNPHRRRRLSPIRAAADRPANVVGWFGRQPDGRYDTRVSCAVIGAWRRR